MKKLYCWTDGSYSKKTKKGSWAYLIKTEPDENFDKVITNAELLPDNQKVTNQVAELQAILQCLKFIKQTFNKSNEFRILICSDSEYCVNGFNDWSKRWKKNNFKTANNSPIQNQEIWKELLELKEYFQLVKLKWVRGHDGNTGNEIVDKLCRELTL